jgi:hypothetical protein
MLGPVPHHSIAVNQLTHGKIFCIDAERIPRCHTAKTCDTAIRRACAGVQFIEAIPPATIEEPS